MFTRVLFFATALLIVATIAILVVTILPLLNSAIAQAANSSVRLSLGDQIWTWVERGSAIITIAGLVALYSQVRQMVRRPKVQVGFHQDAGGSGTRMLQTVKSIKLPVHWQQNNALSEPISLSVVAVNEASASATAYDVNFEVRYPKWLVPEGHGDLKELAIASMRDARFVHELLTISLKGT